MSLNDASSCILIDFELLVTYFSLCLLNWFFSCSYFLNVKDKLKGKFVENCAFLLKNKITQNLAIFQWETENQVDASLFCPNVFHPRNWFWYPLFLYHIQGDDRAAQMLRKESEAHIANLNVDPMLSGNICYFLDAPKKIGKETDIIIRGPK